MECGVKYILLTLLFKFIADLGVRLSKKTPKTQIDDFIFESFRNAVNSLKRPKNSSNE